MNQCNVKNIIIRVKSTLGLNVTQNIVTKKVKSDPKMTLKNIIQVRAEVSKPCSVRLQATFVGTYYSLIRTRAMVRG